jgi:trk system potassium uptake protein TrkH
MGEGILSSFFDSVTARTAGFNSTDTAALSGSSKILTMLLMFIGGSPGSTAGGVKTTTIAVLLIYSFSYILGTRSVGAFGRRFEPDVLRKSCAVFFINLTLALCAVLVIGAVETVPTVDVMFESFSAIGTVGMTTGITRGLSPLSQYILAFLMFCGRVGSLSFATAIYARRAAPPVGNPAEKITLG